MILSKIGECFEYDGKTYTIGDQVTGNDRSAYEGLVGTIVEIRDGEDKETENPTPDIYCSFDAPILFKDITELEIRFSKLYGEKKMIEEIALDYVAMAPDMLVATTELSNKSRRVTVYAVTEDWANNDDYGFTTDLYASRDDAVREFKLRLGMEANNGIIADIRRKSQCVEEHSEEYYECYVDGRHCESHFIIKVEEKELALSDIFMELIADMKVNEARLEDFIEQN